MILALEWRAFCGVGFAFEGEFAGASGIFIRIGPFPPDGVHTGIRSFGSCETDPHGVLDDADRGHATGVLQLPIGWASADVGEIARGVERGGLCMGVDVQFVEAARAVVVKREHDAAGIMLGGDLDDGLEIAGAVEEGEVQDVGGGGAAVLAGDFDPEPARGIHQIARVGGPGDGVAVLVPLIGLMAFRGTDQLGVAILMATRGHLAQVRSRQDHEVGAVGAAVRIDAGGDVGAGVLGDDAGSGGASVPGVVHIGIGRVHVDEDVVPRAGQDDRGRQLEQEILHPFDGDGVREMGAIVRCIGYHQMDVVRGADHP